MSGIRWKTIALEWALGAGLVVVLYPVMVRVDVLEGRDAVSAVVGYSSTLVLVLLLREWLKARADRRRRD